MGCGASKPAEVLTPRPSASIHDPDSTAALAKETYCEWLVDWILAA